jgi:hypothetical protein
MDGHAEFGDPTRQDLLEAALQQVPAGKVS